MAYNNKKNLSCYSINISGLSEKSKIPLDKYIDVEHTDMLAVQETL